MFWTARRKPEFISPICAVAALNNADTDHALPCLLRRYPREILEGLCHVAVAVDAAEKVLLACRGQSCGKCTFCREGLIQLHTMTKEITEGKAGFIHMIDSFECTKCGKCIAECGEDAIIQTSGRVPKLPSRLIKCGKFRAC